MKVYDLIIVLGGGIDKNGVLPPWVVKRLDRVFVILQQHPTQKILLSGKGRDGFPIAEAVSMKKLLLDRGVSANLLLTEDQSEDTIQNAYYCQKLFLKPLQVSSALIITNDFHLLRTELIFKHILGKYYFLEFLGVDNSMIEPELLELRSKTEEAQIEFCNRFFKSFPAGDIEPVEDFLFSEDNYFFKEYQNLGKKLNSNLVLY